MTDTNNPKDEQPTDKPGTKDAQELRAKWPFPTPAPAPAPSPA